MLMLYHFQIYFLSLEKEVNLNVNVVGNWWENGTVWAVSQFEWLETLSLPGGTAVMLSSTFAIHPQERNIVDFIPLHVLLNIYMQLTEKKNV